MRLGYVGLDSSHADALTRMVNVDRPPGLPEARFTHLWGRDGDRAAQLKERSQVEAIVAAPQDMIGKVDAVVVGARHGERHLAEARPFLEAGMAVFIDKPLATTLADAQAILDLARRHGARVTSFSGLRAVPEVIQFKADYAAITAEKYGGAISGHGDNANPYGGWYFYAVHAVELLLEVFAPERGRVLAAEIGRQLHLRVAADSGQVVSILLSPAWPPSSLIGYADHKTVASVVPLGGFQIEVTRRILAFLHGAADLSPRELLAPLKVWEAVLASLASGAEAAFEA